MYHKTFVESNAYCHILILWHVVHFSYAFVIGRLNNESHIASVFACQKFIGSKIEFPKLKTTKLFQKNEVCNFENSKSMNRNFDENQSVVLSNKSQPPGGSDIFNKIKTNFTKFNT